MANREIGASLAEFLVAVPLVSVIGMATLQAGLIYHGKTTLNYAVFEAARTGAVQNAQVAVMRQELGQRLAPVHGGDASQESLIKSLFQTSADVNDVSTTQVRILSPTRQAFDDWGVMSREANGRVIPNVHLRHKTEEIGLTSGVTIQDANLLKIQVIYGLDMEVPVVGRFIAEAMQLIDVENAHYYRRKKFPLSAVATVRMQSEAWEDEVVASLAPSVVPDTDDPVTNEDGSGTDQDLIGPSAGHPTDLPNGYCDEGEFGLGAISELIDTSDYVDQQCAVATRAFTPTDPGVTTSDLNQSDCV